MCFTPLRRTGRVTAVLDIDLDRGEFSTLDALNGWETYTIRDVSTAAWHANRKDHLAWERRLDIFAGYLETRMLRCDAPEAEPTNGAGRTPRGWGTTMPNAGASCCPLTPWIWQKQ